jgi:hypothetical protein
MFLLQVLLPTPTRARHSAGPSLLPLVIVVPLPSWPAIVASTPARSRSHRRLCSHARPHAAVHPACTNAYQGVKVGPLAPFPLRRTSPGSCPPLPLEETLSGRASHPGGASARSPLSTHTLSCEPMRRSSPSMATPVALPSRSASVRRETVSTEHPRCFPPVLTPVLLSTHTHPRTP